MIRAADDYMAALDAALDAAAAQDGLAFMRAQVRLQRVREHMSEAHEHNFIEREKE